MSVPKRIIWVVTCLALTTLACGLFGGAQVAEGDISVVINSPADNSQVATGQEVKVQMTINDPAGVVNRQELQVDGVVVATAEAVAPEGAPAFSIIIPYTPTAPGTYTISAIAYGSDGSQSQPASFTLIVTGEAADEGDEDEDGEPTLTPTATTNPTPVPDARGCTNDMDYVRDVTIPDNTEMTPGQTFTKTWEIRNSGTCDWGGYTLVFKSDQQMGGPGSVTVPATAAGRTAQVSVNLTAPTAPGTYFSRWTMRSSDGDLFGDTIFVKIIVTGDTTPEPSGDGPDLIITSVTTNPAEPEAGQVTTYNVSVKNQGNEDADESTLLAEFEGGSASTTVPALNAGQTQTVSLPGTTPTKGVYEASFTADDDDDIDETNEGNNTLAFDITYVTIHSSGTFTLDLGSYADLDAGTAHGSSTAATDFRWKMVSGTERLLEPGNGATFAVMSGASGLDECAAATLSGSIISGNDPNYSSMPAGTWLCAETSDGRYTAFKIDAIDAATHKLTITYKTYE